jgi:3-phosphoshikimate 1-carboxyvinyltransferase
MKSLKVKKGKLPSTINIPSSKSYANRMLILASLKERPFQLNNLPAASDVTHLIHSLEKVGLLIQRSGNSLTILNSFPACERELQEEISVGEGGTTARFLAAMLLKGSRPYTLLLGPRLSQRPWEEFIDFVNRHGGKARLENRRLCLQGPLKLPKVVKVDCSRTTQFASAIMMSFSSTTEVIPLNMNSSHSYWNLTLQNILDMQKGEVYSVPLDWSSASYPLAFAALSESIDFPELKFDPFQSDAKFCNILKSFSAIETYKEGLRVSAIKEQRSLEVDVSDCLDLVPALSFFLAHIEGRHVLKGVSNLVHKESDRLAEVMKLLGEFKRTTNVDGDALIIKGNKYILTTPMDLILPDDHRMVMTASMFLRLHAGGSLSPVEAVNKSYPGFFDLFQD